MEPSPALLLSTTPLGSAMATQEEDGFTMPEINDPEYLAEVLRLPFDKSERQADLELVARAKALGVAATLPSAASKRHTASTYSCPTLASYQERSFSTGSTASASSVLTPHSSILGPPSPLIGSEPGDRRSSVASLNFGQYERYLASVDSPQSQVKFLSTPPASDSSGQSLLSVSTKKSLAGGFRSRIRWRKKSAQPLDPTLSCITCRQSTEKSGPLHHLPCGHAHCRVCLTRVIRQSLVDESSMPPRCCSQAIPTATVRAVLNQTDQDSFLLAVLKFNTPEEERKFCPNSACGEFLPAQDLPDPRYPFDFTCLKCSSRLCGVCQQAAHPIGYDCPEDWELVAMNKLGNKSKWKRCYQCRDLAKMGESSHSICRCKGQICSLCAGIWDPTTGCPNLCNFDDELERRRKVVEEHMAVAGMATPNIDKPSRPNTAIQQLGQIQQEELQRFVEYHSHAKEDLEARQLTQKAAIIEKYTAQMEKIKERHNKTIAQLEDRQIAAEMELRTSLEQSERAMKLRLKHMEAYCDGLGMNPSSPTPTRVVTERDLRELGQQYNLRDGMERTHQAKINVMRDRQTKQMEELLDSQEEELEKLFDKRQLELDKLGAQFSQEKSQLNNVFNTRRSRMQPRWLLAIEVLCKELEKQTGQSFSRIAPPAWQEEAELTPQNESNLVNHTLVAAAVVA